jgi:hypothetical protein
MAHCRGATGDPPATHAYPSARGLPTPRVDLLRVARVPQLRQRDLDDPDRELRLGRKLGRFSWRDLEDAKHNAGERREVGGYGPGRYRTAPTPLPFSTVRCTVCA